MVWRRLLPAVVATAVVLVVVLPYLAIADAAICTSTQISRGTCTLAPVIVATADPDGVTLEATVDGPGGSGGDGAVDTRTFYGRKVLDFGNGQTVRLDGYAVTAPVKISDLVNFTPTPGTAHMQPSGWMAVGLDTNFFARASSHVKTGVLLEQPASVRFTPAQYRWSYGDGRVATRDAAGATWQVLGVHEFDPTPTSHIYRAPGTYYIDLAIGFAAEYRYASFPSTLWVPVQGIVWVPANRLVAVAGGPKTVLVEKECTMNPRGPGC